MTLIATAIDWRPPVTNWLSRPLLDSASSLTIWSPLSPVASGLIAGDDDLGRRSLERLPDLKVLIRWGIGTDSVDFDAATECGIVVRNTPGVFGEEVADSAFGYILNLARGHHAIDAAVRRGEWTKIEGISLHDQVLGVVGAGSIGSAVMRRGLGFGMRVLVYDPFLNDALPAGAEQVELPQLLAESRFVVLTAPATPRHPRNDERRDLVADEARRIPRQCRARRTRG